MEYIDECTKNVLSVTGAQALDGVLDGEGAPEAGNKAPGISHPDIARK